MKDKALGSAFFGASAAMALILASYFTLAILAAGVAA